MTALTDIERLADGASEGPWELFDVRSTQAVLVVNGKEIIHWAGFDRSEIPLRLHKANAAFIAASRTAVPELIRRAKVLDKLLEQVEALAFEMPAPNAYTPRFMELVVAARAARDNPLPAPPEDT